MKVLECDELEAVFLKQLKFWSDINFSVHVRYITQNLSYTFCFLKKVMKDGQLVAFPSLIYCVLQLSPVCCLVGLC